MKLWTLPPIRQPGLTARLLEAHQRRTKSSALFCARHSCGAIARFAAAVRGEPKGSPGPLTGLSTCAPSATFD
jgi:hypothetical protein